MGKKVYIKTYGCQMNERDSNSVASLLASNGYSIVNDEESADILIFNTCSVRDQAERKAVGKIGIIKRLKKIKPDIFIGVMGCMAQSRGEELLKEIPHLDFVVGTEQLHKLPEIIANQIKKRHQESHTGEDNSAVLTSLGGHFNPEKAVSDFIAVMRGCNRFCSYCIVPYVRGRERSRIIQSIVDEAKKLTETGVREIVLLGQNIAAYGLDWKEHERSENYSPFAELLEKINDIDTVKRIRFASPHPAYFNKRLIEAVTSLPKICNNMHLPLQSGSDRILKLMNRHYTAAHYMKIVEELMSRSSEMTFSTDIIIGFPGETEEDFNATRKVMNDADFDNAFIFKYSKRKNTPAAEMSGQIAQKVKEERNHILLADLKERTEKHNSSLVGKTIEILVEGPSKRNASRWAGRTTTNKVLVFEPDSNLQIGDIINVKVDRSTSMTLFGSIADNR